MVTSLALQRGALWLANVGSQFKCKRVAIQVRRYSRRRTTMILRAGKPVIDLCRLLVRLLVFKGSFPY